MLKNTGNFIVFEGIDGAGTTSQSKLLAKKLKAHWTKEPSDNPIGKVTRELLKNTSYPADKVSMCLMFVADRLQHTSEEIIPTLSHGKNVVCDRYIWSTLAYQRIYFDNDWLIQVHKYDYIDIPSLTFLLDVELNVAEKRRNSRDNSKERYDDYEIQEKVKKNYLNLARQYPSRCVIVDANRDFDVVADEIYEIAMRRLYKNELESSRIGNRGSEKIRTPT